MTTNAIENIMNAPANRENTSDLRSYISQEWENGLGFGPERQTNQALMPLDLVDEQSRMYIDLNNIH